MRDVFILGAGFSKEVSSSMLGLAELSVELRNRRGHLLPDQVLNLGDDVELWLTYLSQPQPWLKEQHNLQNQSLFRECSEQIADIITKATDATLSSSSSPPSWFQHLVSFWHQTRSTVVSLNYDTLVERVARTVESKPPHDDTFTANPSSTYRPATNLSLENIYPIPISDIRRRVHTILGSENVDTFEFLKLHGSVNWYYSGAINFLGETLYFGQVEGWGTIVTGQENESKHAASDKTPLIVPPAAQKAPYFQHETIRRVWQLASEAIQGATRIFALGYSLPTTDLGIRFFLHYSSPSYAIPLFVVNTDPCAPQHYRKMLPAAYKIDDSFVGTDAISRLADQLVRESRV